MKQPSATQHQQKPLNAQMIIDWAKLLLNRNTPQDELKRMALYGLKTPADVSVFLKSKEGQRVKNEILNYLELQKKSQDDLMALSLQERLFMHRLRAFLFLLILSKKSAAADKLMHALYEQFEKTRKENKKAQETLHPAAAQAPTGSMPQLQLIQKDYDLALDDAQKALDEALEEQKALEKEGKILAEKLEGMDTLFIRLEHDFDTFSDDFIMQHHNSAEAVQDTMDKIDHLPQMDDAADDYMQKLNHYKKAHCKDALLVHHRALKYMADANGLQTTSWTNARFVLSHHQKLCEKDGKLYLIMAHENWNDIQNNPEALDAARTAYKASKRDMLTAKGLIQHDHKHGINHIMDLIARNETAKLLNAIDQLVIKHEIVMIKTAQGDLDQMIQEQGKDQPSLQLTPKPVPEHRSEPKKQPAQSFKKRVMALKPISEQQLVDYINGNQFVLDKVQPLLTNPPGTTPIPHQMMQRMLQTLAQFGVDVYQRSLQPRQSPMEQTMHPSTPFDMQLKPGRKS